MANIKIYGKLQNVTDGIIVGHEQVEGLGKLTDLADDLSSNSIVEAINDLNEKITSGQIELDLAEESDIDGMFD